MKRLDLNSDVAEGFGAYKNFESGALYDIITSANVACGFHAGDPKTMAAAVDTCQQRGVAIGAHPGFADLAGFGRRLLQVSSEEALRDLIYQVGALQGFCSLTGQTLQHIKPHGALYNWIMGNEVVAEVLIGAFKAWPHPITWLALSGSPFAKACGRLEAPVALEVFADRAYNEDGSLVDRRLPGAVLTDHAVAIDQVKRIVLYQEVKTLSGKVIPMQADSVCVHGDHAESLKFAEHLRVSLEAEGIRFKAFGQI